MPALYLIFALVLMVSVYLNYKSLSKTRRQIQGIFSHIIPQLKERLNTLSRMIQMSSSVKRGPIQFFEEIKSIGRAIYKSKTLEDRITNERLLTSKLQNLDVAIETHPELTTNQEFLTLHQKVMQRLMGENMQKNFDEIIEHYNNSLRSFPTNILKYLFNFREIR